LNFIFWTILAIIVIIILGILVLWLVQRGKATSGHTWQILMEEDNSLSDNRQPVHLNFMTDKEKKQMKGEMVNAWAIDAANQVYDKGLGGYIQVSTMRDVTPVRLFGDEPEKVTKTTMEKMAHQVTEDEINYSVNKHFNPSTLNRLTWIAILLALGLIMEIAAKMHVAGVF
jgi:hypothetical protein